jgi:hypothetical protein
MMPITQLSAFDRDLLEAIRAAAGADGTARSLFDVAVRRAGLDYDWAHYRLGTLEALGYVQVVRPGNGIPLIMRPLG